MVSKIQQHVYTRAKRTLFQQAEGYGTVAKTNALTEAFIKENIHPYCVYPMGGRADVITVAHFPCGRMLIGRAVYVLKDFTGQRATFFAHNYILPPQMAGEILNDIEKLQNVKFLAEPKGDLCELDSLPMQSEISPRPRTTPQVVAKLENLSQYIQSSVYGTKKTYIILPASGTISAIDILSIIYPHLPEETTHQLGFCTYATEPASKKGLHLMFIPEQAYLSNRAKFAKDFVVNFDQVTGEKIPLPQTPPMLDPRRFFQQTEFLHTRLTHHKKLHYKSCEWLAVNLDTLTLQQFTAVPDSFILRGKSSSVPDLFIILGILKICANAISAGTSFDLRYFLGSYALCPQSYFRIIQNLRRLYQNHISSENYLNISFLFRARGVGRLDTNGLKKYLEKFAGSVECMEKVMLY